MRRKIVQSHDKAERVTMFQKRLDDRTCPICGVSYHPTSREQVTCGKFCARVWLTAIRLYQYKHKGTSRDECAQILRDGGMDLEPIKKTVAERMGQEASAKEKMLTRRKCHGWIDRSGKLHPCSRMITDYRCSACWAKTRANAGCGDWGDGDD